MIHRNVILLTIAQALATSGASLVVFVGGLIGGEIAPSPELATLPVSMLVIGLALFTVPASLTMQRFGRRAGFINASLLGSASALLAGYAISAGSFPIFCLSILLIGGNLAFVQQFRFAVAESVPPQQVNRAVSSLLLGGIVAGFLGPEIARQARLALPYGEYSGSFAILAGLYLLVAGLLLFFKEVRPIQSRAITVKRSTRQLLNQPGYRVAALGGIVAYAVMSLIMTATPIHMHLDAGHSLDMTAFVVQSHVIAMYMPSLFTGWTISRLGVTRVMTAGALAMTASTLLGFAGSQAVVYWLALVLLGLGWNFLFIGGTVLLTRNYHPSERFRAQALNDFLIFAVQALASLSAGALLAWVSWVTLNLIALPALIAVMIAIGHLHRSELRQAGKITSEPVNPPVG